MERPRVGDDEGVNSDDLFPELAFGFDGHVYVNIAGFKYPERLEHRTQFVGWELNEEEFSWELVADCKLRDLRDVVVAVDGTFYGNADRIPPEKRAGRHMLRVFALREGERKEAFNQMQMIAFNVTVGVQAAMAEERQKGTRSTPRTALRRASPTRTRAKPRRAV
jgi:hypothetical protein